MTENLNTRALEVLDTERRKIIRRIANTMDTRKQAILQEEMTDVVNRMNRIRRLEVYKAWNI